MFLLSDVNVGQRCAAQLCLTQTGHGISSGLFRRKTSDRVSSEDTPGILSYMDGLYKARRIFRSPADHKVVTGSTDVQ